MKRTFLQVLPLTLLLVALFSIFTISPVSAATQQHALTARPKVAQDDSVICYYKTTDALNYRDAPNGNYVNTYPKGTIVAAYRDVLVKAGNFTWRKLDNDDWAATEWLQKTSQLCVS